MKKKVVILSVADWAGSQYQACQAVKSVGEFDCRHITMFRHPFEYPTDVLIPAFPTNVEPLLCGYKEYGIAKDIVNEADIVHLWNTVPWDQALCPVGFPLPFHKIKVMTFTGSYYRDNHKGINQVLKDGNPDIKVTVQNPMLKFPDEVDSVFIPHAVDTETLKPIPFADRKQCVGTYRALDKNPVRPTHIDIPQLYEAVREFSGWHVDLDYALSWKERMERLKECSIFVQDISSHMGYWGRSTLEACALGVPTITNYSILDLNDVLNHIPIIPTHLEIIHLALAKLIREEEYRKEVGQKSRKWVESHFSYPVVGKMYSEVYAGVL